MNDGKHAGNRLRRGLYGLPLSALFVAALAGTAVALWAFVFDFAGTVTTGDLTLSASGGSAVASGGTCNVVGEFPLTVVWTDGVAGDECVVTANYQGAPGNSTSLKLQSFDLVAGPGGDAWTPGLEMTSTLGAFCGAEVVGAATANVDIVLTLTGDSAPGAAYDIAGSSATWVAAAGYDPGACS